MYSLEVNRDQVIRLLDLVVLPVERAENVERHLDCLAEGRAQRGELQRKVRRIVAAVMKPQAAVRIFAALGRAAFPSPGRYERTPERTTRRNGTRQKVLATPAGEVDLALAKLREGSFFPSLLHPRRRVDKALYAASCASIAHQKR